jgi:hypothetical protein
MITHKLTSVACLTALAWTVASVVRADDNDPQSQPEAAAAAPAQEESAKDDKVESEAPATADAADKDKKDESEPAKEESEPGKSLLLEDEAWLNDPFTVLEGEMQETVGYLDKGKTNPPAEVLQPLIIDRLDIMIQLLEQSCNGGNGGGQNPSRPANASTLRSGADRRGEMRAAKKDGRKWAELTEKERQKILQSKTDGFPAGYDDILADYFRKLSRTEQPAGDKPADDKPSVDR